MFLIDMKLETDINYEQAQYLTNCLQIVDFYQEFPGCIKSAYWNLAIRTLDTISQVKIHEKAIFQKWIKRQVVKKVS